MKYSATVFDDIGNEYPRKNLLLLAQSPAEDESGLADDRLSDYREQRAKALSDQKVMLSGAGDRRKAFLEDLDGERDSICRRWLLWAAESQVRADHYQPLTGLDYDFELAYKEHAERARQLPAMARERRALLGELAGAQEALAQAKKGNHEEAVQDFKDFRKERQLQLAEEKKALKEAHQTGLISAKAYANEKRENRLAYRDQVRVRRRQLPVKAQKEAVRYARHRLARNKKSGLGVLNADISDIRRKTPLETSKTRPLISWLTWPLPGLGQLLLGQRLKALFFFLGTLFLYLVAIPYALGRGNYRGQGIYGLISLAAGGSRLDRSVIFMIEGLIAIFLLLMGLFLLYQSFRDVNSIEKRMIRGVRQSNWFETRTAVRRSGFPFFASAPAALVTLFIVLLPIAVTILISFTNYDPAHQSKFNWTGLANYKQIVMGQGIAGGPFWHITGWTIIWTLLATSFAILLGFVLALLVNQDRIYGKRLFRTVYLLPWAVPAFITILFFSIMFSPEGPLTSVLSSLTGQVTNIKYSVWGTRTVLILLQGWLGSSYVFLLCTGILQGIPHDLYEAARIDGATGFQATRHITIPILLFQTAPLMIGQYTFNFNNFSIIYLFNGGGPFEPTKYGNIAGSSDLLISYIYKLTIQKQYQGIGSAITLIVSLVLIFFAWFGFSRSKAFREEKL